MTREEYLYAVEKQTKNEEYIKRLESVYGEKIPEILYGFISLSKEALLIDDKGWTTLNIDVIVNASKLFHTDLITKKLIPVIDVMDNDFIVYDLNKKSWAEYNIVEECLFMHSDNIESF